MRCKRMSIDPTKPVDGPRREDAAKEAQEEEEEETEEEEKEETMEIDRCQR